ncbi:hypothetical protein GGI07_002313 [Coemansia sp. Benny D115]|nr:hypothetical protein GGI07_002313 [Coemansia sp. Benny D115]
MFLFKSSAKYSLNGKVAIVTGALGAIGRELVMQLLQAGAHMSLIDIASTEDGQLFCDAVNSGYGQTVAKYLQADLSKKDEIDNVIRWTIEQFGCIDILVNNAGIASPAMLYESEMFERIAAILDINLRAPIEATRLFAKYLTENNKQGVVVNMASMGGLAPNRGGEVYGAAKAALIHLTRASKSLAPQVRVSAIAPYYVRTPMVLNNPKLKNNSTVYPQLMLDVDQVCKAAVKCIEDPSSAGKTYALIGRFTYTRMWLFDIALFHITLLAGWSLLISFVKGLLRIK